jgi:DNA-directed RNA polymerase subunit L
MQCREGKQLVITVKILNKSSNELKIEVEGAGHTLCNLVQKRLMEDEHVDLAGYDVPHPLSSSAMIFVRTKGRTRPEEVLSKAVESARNLNKEFGEQLKKALKKS